MTLMRRSTPTSYAPDSNSIIKCKWFTVQADGSNGLASVTSVWC